MRDIDTKEKFYNVFSNWMTDPVNVNLLARVVQGGEALLQQAQRRVRHAERR